MPADSSALLIVLTSNDAARALDVALVAIAFELPVDLLLLKDVELDAKKLEEALQFGLRRLFVVAESSAKSLVALEHIKPEALPDLLSRYAKVLSF